MVYGLPFDEDAYWERVREEYEKPHIRTLDEGPFYEYEFLPLEGQIDDIEDIAGCSMGELLEGDLLDIVANLLHVAAISARWDEQYGGIEYKYEAEPIPV